MKLNYKGEINLSSKGHSFSKLQDTPYEVSDQVGIYLLQTFPKLFEEIVEKKIEKKVEPKKEEIVEEKKVEVKAKTKAK